jgi:sugar phosphate isomerase/epimerase
MKLSCTPISLAQTLKKGQMDLRGFLRYCAEQQIDGVDLLDSQSYPWLWKDLSTELDRVAAWAKEDGLKIAAYGCGNNFAKNSDADFREQVALVHNALDEASRCGAPLLRIFGGYHHQTGGEPGMGLARGFERVIQGIDECLPHAEKRGVILALENHGRLPGHSWEIESLIRRFDSPWLRVTFDPANFIANNMDEIEDPLRAYARLKNHIAHVHVKDFGPAKKDLKRRVEPCLNGEGLTPIRQILAELIGDDYPGFCSLEYESNLVVPELQGVPLSFEYFKEFHRLSQVLGAGKTN